MNVDTIDYFSLDHPLRKLASKISFHVRRKIFASFMEILRPTARSRVLDVGVTPDRTLPESNFLEGKVVEVKKDRVCVEAKQGLNVWVENRLDLEPGEDTTVTVRPEKIQIFPDGTQPPEEIVNSFPGRIEEVIYVGEANVYRVVLKPDVTLKIKVQSAGSTERCRRGDKVVVGWQVNHGLPLK